jgi:rfaE bifunctional protein nucleotidyltransferase chain/domain
MKRWEDAAKTKVIAPEKIEEKASALRTDGYKIATLNGSFDLLHSGHLEILFQASQCADKLIVALNSDCSIQKYKSTDRPIIPLEHRLKMMAALSFVDYVTWFYETDPRNLLAKIKPNVHVNGSEYGESCVEAEVVKEYGGRVHIVSLVPGLSTSEILKKVRACAS